MAKVLPGQHGPSSLSQMLQGEFLNVWSSPTCLSVTERLLRCGSLVLSPRKTPAPHDLGKSALPHDPVGLAEDAPFFFLEDALLHTGPPMSRSLSCEG